MTTITNSQFAESVGIHFTMASRLRNGFRSPGLATVIATMRAYNLTCKQTADWLEAIALGPTASGAWLRANIFTASEPVEQVA